MKRFKAWYARKRCRNAMVADAMARMYVRAYGVGSTWWSQSERLP